METDREFSAVVELPGMPGASILTRSAAPEDPDHATAATVERMAAAIYKDADSPPVFAATAAALRSAADGSHEAACEAIYRWIANAVRFRSDDPALRALIGLDNELDFLTHPARLVTMRQPAEDCDGFTMLACAMLLCAGVPCEIVTIKADPDEPWRFSHVYCQALIDGGPLCMDCSQAAQHGFPIGWEAPEYFERQAWGVLAPAPKGKAMNGYGPAARGVGAFDWGAIVSDAFKLTSQLAMRPGQYVQNAQGVMASNVPGALPGQYPSNAAVNLGGVSSTTVLIGGAALLAVVLLAGRR